MKQPTHGAQVHANISLRSRLPLCCCQKAIASPSASLPLRECPSDLKPAVASLIYAAPRCADKEQLMQAQKALAKKFHTVATAADSLAPNCGVHPTVSFLTASGDPSGVPKVDIVAPFLPLYIASSCPFLSTQSFVLGPQQRTHISLCSLWCMVYGVCRSEMASRVLCPLKRSRRGHWGKSPRSGN